MAIFFLGYSSPLIAQHLTITHLNVGQGDATVIQVKDGPTVLIDAGLPGKGDEIVAPWLSKAGVTHLDALIASHYHADHTGGIPEVIEALSPDSVLLIIDRGSQLPLPRSKTFAAYHESISRVKHHRSARPGLKLRLSNTVSLACIAANGVVATKGIVAWERRNENDLSLAWVLTVSQTVENRRFVFRYFTGGDCGGYIGSHADIETPMSGVIGEVDAFKVNHHGSKYSTNIAFLTTLQPRVAVISVGNGNRYGHPAEQTLERLESSRSVQFIYQTENGSSAPSSNIKIVGNVRVAVYDSFFVAHQDTFRLACEDIAKPEPVMLEQAVQAVAGLRLGSVPTLRFEVADSITCSITIYNLLGQPVGAFPQTPYNVGVNNLNLGRFNLPAGLYLVLFTSGKQRTVKRIALR